MLVGASFFTVLLVVYTTLALLQGAPPEPYLWGIILGVVILGAANVFARRGAREALKHLGLVVSQYLSTRDEEIGSPQVETAQEDDPVLIYSLVCQSCGYHWEKTAQEWEGDLHNEAEDHQNGLSPALLRAELMEEPEPKKITWRPADGRRDNLLVAAAVILLLLAFGFIRGVMGALSRSDRTSLFILSGVGVVYVLLISVGLARKANPRTAKLFSVTIILIIVFALWFLGVFRP